MQQITLAKAVAYAGVGLHSGKTVHMAIKPAPANTGLMFVRPDLPGQPSVEAKAANVTSIMRASAIANDKCRFFTIEHIMSALHASGIDNCYVEMDSEEPPVADGGSADFMKLLAEAGRQEQDAERQEIVIDKVYRIDDGDRFIMIMPYDGFRVSFTSINPHPVVGIQYCDFIMEGDNYEKEIAPCRTIAYEKEVEQLRTMGLGLGCTLENAIVYGDEGWLNDKLFFPDELVRHKVLDAVGDLRLAGPIKGHVVAVKSGHALNTALAKQIAKAFGRV